MALLTVADYITEAAALSQDVGFVRYSQFRYTQALDLGLGEMFRLRPDLFYGNITPPSYQYQITSTPVVLPVQFSQPLLMYMVGHIQLTDAQGNEDERAGALMAVLSAKLTNKAAL